MIQSLLTKETPEIIRFFRNIGSLSEMLDKQEEKLRPVLNGERYITDCEPCRTVETDTQDAGRVQDKRQTALLQDRRQITI